MRQPRPYWKKTHNCYYLNLDGETIRLDPDKKIAFDLYHKKMAGRLPLEADCLVSEVMERFLAHHRADSKPATLEFYEPSIRSFLDYLEAKRLKRLRVSKIKAYHVTDWIKDRHQLNARSGKPTSDTHRHNLIRAIKAAFNWAEEEELIDRAPLRKLKKPPQQARDVYLMPDQWDKLVAAVKAGQDAGPFLDVIWTMHETGSRPSDGGTGRRVRLGPVQTHGRHAARTAGSPVRSTRPCSAVGFFLTAPPLLVRSGRLADPLDRREHFSKGGVG